MKICNHPDSSSETPGAILFEQKKIKYGVVLCEGMQEKIRFT